MLKVAQPRTIVELQQIEIHSLSEWKRSQTASQASPSAAELKAQEEASTQKATKVLKKVLHKHNYQREKHAFVQERRPGGEVKAGEDMSNARTQLFQRSAQASQRSNATGKSRATSLDSAVSSKIPIVDDVVDVATDGTGLVGDALGDAYEAAEDQVSFVANTVIDSVEMAVDILLRGFTDWNAGCDENRWPSMSVDSNGLDVDWGRQKCWVRLMGQTCTLFDFNFGTTALSWPEPLKTAVEFGIKPIKAVFGLGRELVHCATIDSPVELIKCFGYKLIEVVPPLSTLNRLSDMLTNFIEVFAKIAASVIRKVLEDKQSLVQQAAVSKFPAAGSAAVVHHSSKNLVIKTHAQHPKRTKSKLPRELSAAQVRTEGDDDDGGGAQGSISFAVHDQDGNYATKLITQFNGKETDTSSCLAFAPKNKHGSHNQATESDWQVSNEGDFIQLEPWAVPCDNSWMKDHWDKWQGYSFYTWEMSIEKCVTVSYALSMQPVLSFVGGMEFDLMPAPLASLDTVVCWPDKQPGGVDLSVLRSEIRSAGVLLFSRTLRLTKRFGGGTDFTDENTFGAHETWRNPIGIATGQHAVEDDRTLEPMARTSLTQGNHSLKASEAGAESRERIRGTEDSGTLVWETDVEDFHLASIDYGQDLSINKTSEKHGAAAFSALQGEDGKADYFQLFSFKNPGMASFEVQGLLEDNSLELGMKVRFGPFESPEKRIPLINIVDQFSIVLTALPFVSVDTKMKALASLRGFTKNDMEKVAEPVPPPALRPGSMIALYSKKWKRYLRMNDQADLDGSGTRELEDGVPDDWSWERFTVVDGGNGQIALHSSKWNRFVKMADDEMTASAVKAANLLPPPNVWTWERFTVVYVGDGEIALHNSLHNRYIRLGNNGHVDSSSTRSIADGVPDDWSWERFTVVEVKPYLKPGSVVALHSAKWNRFLRMNNNADMDRSSEKAVNELPDGWSWERFRVVDGQNGQVALHSAKWNRFIKMNDENMEASIIKAADDLPPPTEWTYERFAVVPAGNGEIALHNTLHNRFVRMTDQHVDGSGHKNAQDLPSNWDWERFRVVEVSDLGTDEDDSGWSFQAR
ncbi:unnamed protein product [Symbiodinium natans]|uniref:Uncharacterized protein n=1 Tax=Symbiodinium natans TaxID=878477 RepID=A0A812V016_9DINO|nr:unnamed protein product [Symbiodinium natans]